MWRRNEYYHIVNVVNETMAGTLLHGSDVRLIHAGSRDCPKNVLTMSHTLQFRSF